LKNSEKKRGVRDRIKRIKGKKTLTRSQVSKEKKKVREGGRRKALNRKMTRIRKPTPQTKKVVIFNGKEEKVEDRRTSQ